MIHLLISCNVAGPPLEEIAEEEEQPKEEEDIGDEDNMADFMFGWHKSKTKNQEPRMRISFLGNFIQAFT